MYRKIFTLVLGVVAAGLLSGCVTARTYVVNKERVDQEIPGQPANTPVKTRKIIVLEVVEKDKAVTADAKAAPVVPVVATAPAVKENDFTLPQASEPVVSTPAAVEPTMYVVQKDDTLQKIAKKFYGSYGKWTKIYDANRDVIKDPNFLKSGVTLQLPVLDQAPASEQK